MDSTNTDVRIEAVSKGPELETIRGLIQEYLAYLNADLSFQDIETELEKLPGKYAAPYGALFLASVPGERGVPKPAGCVALRKLDDGVCEMKRLYVQPECRGCGVGKALADRIIQEARDLGYKKMRLDTLERLEEAVSMYRALGFKTIQSYCENPLPGAMFWEKEL